MKSAILERFNVNIKRAKNLLSLYSQEAGSGQGRRGVEETDILRATVVFLHASLEEVLRGLEQWKLPSGPKGKLDNVPLVGLGKGARPEKFYLGELQGFAGKTIDAVLEDSIKAHLDRTSYNSMEDVARVLELCAVQGADVEAAKQKLAEPIARRHRIVHQADRQEQAGKGYGVASPIQKPDVETWVADVESFVKIVADKL